MSQPNVNPTPRERFQAIKDNVTQHRAMIERPSFDRGADAALLEYQRILAEAINNGNDAAAAGFKLQGAAQFLTAFKRIAESPQPITERRDYDNLPELNALKGK